jgi:hypothetical protein
LLDCRHAAALAAIDWGQAMQAVAGLCLIGELGLQGSLADGLVSATLKPSGGGLQCCSRTMLQSSHF